MNYFSTWGEAFRVSFQSLWIRFINFIPQFLGAIIILVLGFALATALAKLVRKFLEFTKVDDLIARTGVLSNVEMRGRRVTLSGFLGWLVKWFIILVTLITVSDILGIPQITSFLEDVARYIPNVVVAVVIMVIGLTAGNFVQGVVVSGVAASRIPTSSAGFLGALAKWAITIFALMAALVQLGVASSLVQILFTGLVGMMALAGGLAFGLGGRDKATRWLDRIEKEMVHGTDRM